MCGELAYHEGMDRLRSWLASRRGPSEGHRLPGEKSRLVAEDNRRNGLVLPKSVVSELDRIAEELHVAQISARQSIDPARDERRPIPG
jgi:LDH2 family malate/lactate/ureidoglycolate dehydrogenase